MSQRLTPIDSGIQKIETTTVTENRLPVLSPQYIESRNLEEQSTQWIPGGRPIYRRLPSTSETYQIDFFNVVPAPNTAVAAQVQDIGYVYTPWSVPQNGENSLYVSLSASKRDLLIKGGTIVWKYGNTDVIPVIANLEIVEVSLGRYDVSYQLLYDDSPLQKLYEVEDFILTGLPLNITSSTDNIVGWRYSSVNAFLNTSDFKWANKDTYFPPFAQPTQSYLQWESELAMAYRDITLRCPPGTAITGTATLNFFDGVNYTFIDTVDISSDANGQFFQFAIEPRFKTGWQVVFSSLDVSIESVTVSGIITLLEKQAEPSARATLVMWATGSSPKTVTNEQGEIVPATYCPLATIEVDRNFNITKIEDTRYIIHRDYQPVAEWLTRPFDEDLINLYEQVSGYATLWMAPSFCMKQEYIALEGNQIQVEI